MMRRISALLFLTVLPISTALSQPVLPVVTEISPPHQTLEKGKVGGVSTELVRLIMHEAGFKADIAMYPWARAYHIAKTQPNTLIYNMARTDSREQHFHWIGHVAAYQLGFVSLQSEDNDLQIHSTQDAKRYVTAVQRGDFSAEWLIQQGFKEGVHLLLTADIEESWTLLRKGKVDLVIDDIATMGEMLKIKDSIRPSVKLQYPIPALNQQTWLAANINTPPKVINKLIEAHDKVRQTEQYRRVMNSDFENATKIEN